METNGRRLLLGALGTVWLAGGLVSCGDDVGQESDLAPGSTAASSSGDTFSGTAAVPAGATNGDGYGGDTASALPSQLDRKIIYNAMINLQVGDISQAFGDVSAIARVAGGYIEKSSFSGSDDTEAKDRSATLTIRVPSVTYEDTLAKLRGLPGVKVKRESAKSSEVTEQYTDLQSRLRVLQSTEQSYLKLLGQAQTIPDILTMTDRLNGVRTQVEQVQGRINVLDHLTDLASIDVALAPLPVGVGNSDKAKGPKGVTESFAAAWAASIEGGRYLASAAAILAVGAIWLAIPAGVAALGVRMVRRRHPRAGA